MGPTTLRTWPTRWRRQASLALVASLALAGVHAGTGSAALVTPRAASIDPTAVELSLSPGASSTVAVNVSTPEIGPRPDIVFLADTTGSMDPALANVRNYMPSMIEEIRAIQPDARFAVTEYKEQRDGPRAFQVNTPFTDDELAVQDGAQQWFINVGGGGQPWTDFINAHYRIATDAVVFRPNGTRIIAWFGDGQSHDPSLGHTLADTLNALRAAGIQVVAVPVVGGAAPGLDNLGQATSITSGANGVLMPDRSMDQVAQGLIDGIKALTVTVRPQVTCANGLNVTFDPAARTVRAGTTASFTETIAVAPGTAAGDYQCSVDFLVNSISTGLAQTITVHVSDTGPLPSMSVGDVSVTEGDTGTAPATFTVSLSEPSAEPVTAHWATADGTATAGEDFIASAGDVAFAPGETTAQVTVPVVGDTVIEVDETFTVALTNASGATVDDASGVATIVNDDDEITPPGPTMRVGDVSVTEGNTGTVPATFTVTLSEPSAESVTAHWATAEGTATAPEDFIASAGEVTFAPGETSAQVTVPVTGDTEVEADETFTVGLSGVEGAAVGDAAGVATIVNDDEFAPPPTMSVGDVSVTEGDAGTVPATFTVSLSEPSAQSVTAHWATADGTATAPDDFTSSAGDVTFAPGQTSKQVTVPVVGDTVVEADETFTVALTNASGATVNDASGVATIVNDDQPLPPPSLSVDDVTVSEDDAAATFTVNLDRPSADPVSVRYATANGTATAPADYRASSGDVVFAPGETARQVTVPIVSDSIDEPAETFTVGLSAPSGATISDATASATIVDADRDGVFSCAASAGRLLGSQLVVANPARTPCKDRTTSASSSSHKLLLLQVRVSALTAATDQTPDDLSASGPAAGDRAVATASAGAARISALGLNVEIGAITASASARCVAGSGGALAPLFSGRSSIGSLKINGVTVPVGARQLTIPLLLGSLKLNATTTGPASVTQRAIELRTVFGDVVIGDAHAGVAGSTANPAGNPCQA